MRAAAHGDRWRVDSVDLWEACVVTDENNPFRAPRARVDDPIDSDFGGFLLAGRRVPPGHAARWLASGWRIFRAAPGTWVGITIVLLLIIGGLGVVPVVSLFLNLFFAVFVAGIVTGCRSLEQGNGLRLAHLFAGFSNRLGSLVLASLLYFLAMVPLLVIIGAAVAIGVAAGVRGNEANVAVGILIVVGTVVTVPLAMALWLASPLIVFQQLAAYEALKAGFLVAVRNFLPLLAYGLLVLVAALLASLPFFLGWLVLIPVMHASLYAFYRDVFFVK